MIVCACKTATGRNTPQGVEKVHSECRIVSESYDRGKYTVKRFDHNLEKRYIKNGYYYYYFFIFYYRSVIEFNVSSIIAGTVKAPVFGTLNSAISNFQT